MLEDSDIQKIVGRLASLEAAVMMAIELLQKRTVERHELNGYVSEAEARRITGLSKSQLLKMRKEGKLSESSLAVKTPWYKLSDFSKLLKENERKR